MLSTCSVLTATSAVLSMRVGMHAQVFSLLVHAFLQLDLLQLKPIMQVVCVMCQRWLR